MAKNTTPPWAKVYTSSRGRLVSSNAQRSASKNTRGIGGAHQERNPVSARGPFPVNEERTSSTESSSSERAFMCTDRRRSRALLPPLPFPFLLSPLLHSPGRPALSFDYYPTQSVVLYATPRHGARKVSRSFPRTPCQPSPLRSSVLPTLYVHPSHHFFMVHVVLVALGSFLLRGPSGAPSLTLPARILFARVIVVHVCIPGEPRAKQISRYALCAHVGFEIIKEDIARAKSTRRARSILS